MSFPTGPWLGRSVLLVVAVVVAAYPFVSDTYPTWQLAVRICYFLLLVLSWNVVSGFAGLFSFGHVAFAVIGAYGSALVAERGVALPLAMAIGGVLAGLVGALLGALSLRVRGPYLVVVTFSFLGFVQIFVTAEQDLTGGSSGMSSESLFRLAEIDKQYLVGVALVVAFLAGQQVLLRSHWYHYLIAIRDNEFAASALGGHPRRWKVMTFTSTAAVAGIAGAFFGQALGFIQPGMGSVGQMSMIVAIGMIGGLGTVVGPVVATVGLLVVDNELRNSTAGLSALLFGLALLVVVTTFPRGLSGIPHQLASVARSASLRTRRREVPSETAT